MRNWHSTSIIYFYSVAEQTAPVVLLIISLKAYIPLCQYLRVSSLLRRLILPKLAISFSIVHFGGTDPLVEAHKFCVKSQIGLVCPAAE